MIGQIEYFVAYSTLTSRFVFGNLSLMPSRKDVFVNGGIYHIFNKTIDKRRIFSDESICRVFLDVVSYYRSTKADIRYSRFLKLEPFIKRQKENEIRYKKYFKVIVLSYCLMPNHFHLLLKQKIEGGIIRFVADTINAFTRFYNILHERKGPLFLTQFKSRRVRTTEELMHVSRYIHLNPYSGGLVDSFEQLEKYRWSSLPDYLGSVDRGLCDEEIVLNMFDGEKGKYRAFVRQQAEYQKRLEQAKHRDELLES